MSAERFFAQSPATNVLEATAMQVGNPEVGKREVHRKFHPLSVHISFLPPAVLLKFTFLCIC